MTIPQWLYNPDKIIIQETTTFFDHLFLLFTKNVGKTENIQIDVKSTPGSPLTDIALLIIKFFEFSVPLAPTFDKSIILLNTLVRLLTSSVIPTTKANTWIFEKRTKLENFLIGILGDKCFEYVKSENTNFSEEELTKSLENIPELEYSTDILEKLKILFSGDDFDSNLIKFFNSPTYPPQEKNKIHRLMIRLQSNFAPNKQKIISNFLLFFALSFQILEKNNAIIFLNLFKKLQYLINDDVLQFISDQFEQPNTTTSLQNLIKKYEIIDSKLSSCISICPEIAVLLKCLFFINLYKKIQLLITEQDKLYVSNNVDVLGKQLFVAFNTCSNLQPSLPTNLLCTTDNKKGEKPTLDKFLTNRLELKIIELSLLLFLYTHTKDLNQSSIYMIDRVIKQLVQTILDYFSSLDVLKPINTNKLTDFSMFLTLVSQIPSESIFSQPIIENKIYTDPDCFGELSNKIKKQLFQDLRDNCKENLPYNLKKNNFLNFLNTFFCVHTNCKKLLTKEISQELPKIIEIPSFILDLKNSELSKLNKEEDICIYIRKIFEGFASVVNKMIALIETNQKFTLDDNPQTIISLELNRLQNHLLLTAESTPNCKITTLLNINYIIYTLFIFCNSTLKNWHLKKKFLKYLFENTSDSSENIKGNVTDVILAENQFLYYLFLISSPPVLEQQIEQLIVLYTRLNKELSILPLNTPWKNIIQYLFIKMLINTRTLQKS